MIGNRCSAGLLALAAAFNLLTGTLDAQRPHLRAYGIRDGMPNPHVDAVTQDGAGLMWFLSRSGPISYDGQSWVLHRVGPPSGPAKLSHRLQTDARGRIWATSQRGVWVRDAGAWRLHPYPKRLQLRERGEAVRGFSTASVEGHTRVAVSFRDRPLRIWDGATWREVAGPSPECVHHEVTALAGTFYLGTDRGLMSVPATGGRLRRLPLELPGAEVEVVTRAVDGRSLWLVGGTWIARYIPEEGVIEPLLLDHDLRAHPAPSIALRAAADAVGGIYVGHTHRVVHVDASGKVSALSRESGLAGNGGLGFFLDREGNQWITTSRGVTKVISRRFLNYAARDGLLETEVASLAETREGVMVLGHNAGGLSLISPQGSLRTLELRRDHRRGRVMDIEPTREGGAWIAIEHVGLARLEADGSTRWVDEAAPHPPVTVREDREGALWIGTKSDVFRWHEGRRETLDTRTEGARVPNLVRRIVHGDSGTTYALTRFAGPLLFRGDRRLACETPPALRSTYTALEDSQGRAWIGTSAGLARLIEGRVRLSAEPVVNRPIYSLLEDARGRLWIGTDNGFFVWDGHTTTHRNADHGLPGNEANRSAAHVDRTGRIWLGTDGGLSIYDAREDAGRRSGPRVEDLRLEAEEIEVAEDGALRLLPHAHNLTVRFTAISFLDEERVRFRTRLEGLEGRWSPPRLAPLREIRYASLPPGEYRFHIQPIDIEGREGPVVSSARIVVMAPLWKRPWAVGLALLVVVGLGVGGYGYWTERRHGRELEQQVLEKTEELRTAERTSAKLSRLDSLGVLAGGIAHDFNNLLMVIAGNLTLLETEEGQSAEARENITDALRACQDAEGLTRQLLTFARGGDPVRQTASIAEVLSDAIPFALRGAQVDHQLEIAPDLPPSEIDVAQMRQVFCNLAINARQAMPHGGTIRVTASHRPASPPREGSFVTIEVSDEGGGIPPEVIDRIFEPYFSTKSRGQGLGLAIVHSIVRKHGGEVAVRSTPGEGSTFCITLPASPMTAEAALARPRPVGALSGRVLVMDDEAMVRSVATQMLRKLGCETGEAPHGAAAIKAYQQAARGGRPFDAVLMDLTVTGGMGGREATRRILAEFPDARIIVCSGYANDEAFTAPASLGFRGRLAKPFRLAELAAVLETVLP